MSKLYTGRIIKGISGFYYVHEKTLGVVCCKAKGSFRKDKIKPLVGDLVNFEITSGDEGNIQEIIKRSSQMIRPAVANASRVLLTFAMKEPDPSFNLIDRLIIYYKRINLPVILVFNKEDKADELLVEYYKDIYKDSGIDTYFISSYENKNIDTIKNLLSEGITVITGPSGAGKSTLINKLVPSANMQTGDISDKLRRGKHTTRHTELFYYGDGAYIMDTPGFTAFEAFGIDAISLKNYYAEFKSYAKDCKFDDCVHIGESCCKVKDAVASGKINSVRYNNYKLLYEEIKSSKKY